MESGTTLAQITEITLQTTIIATVLMIILGVVLISSQITKHLAAKQQQLEEYVLSLEKANKDLQRTRKELQLSEKLASLGYLAAGIAHEIGNPLGAALGYIELLQKHSLESEKARDILQRTEQEIGRIRQILQGLVNFSRPHTLHLQTVDINPLIRKVVSHLPALPEKTISIDLKLTEFPLFAEVDTHKLHSVFFNILCNAVDSIATSGQIVISTSRRIRESETIIGGSEVIAIQFSDTGSGISEEHLTRIFEPFFTTKDPGKGMGLGLSLCHRIVETLNGEMEIHSVYGKGTDVNIFLPPAKKTK
jgi:signal transduction histidine kinase